MKKHLSLLLSSLLLSGSLWADDSSTGSQTSSDVTVGRMRCEYLVNPLGLDAPQPRLEWLLVPSASTPRNLSQKSYHLLVASSPELLARNQGDLWDSGEVASDENTQVAYAGKPLSSREECFWKVRVTDSIGRATAWSKPALWEMGLLHLTDWQAKWIDASRITVASPIHGTPTILQAFYEASDGNNGKKDVTDIVSKMVQANTPVAINLGTFGGDPAPNHVKQLRVSYTLNGKKDEAVEPDNTTLVLPAGRQSIPYLRKDFDVTKPVAKARLFVTALGLYELHLNGQRVGNQLFAPGWTNYNIRVRYQAYDVTSLLKNGANTLAGFVGPGWYCGQVGFGATNMWGNAPGLFSQLEVTYTDGSVDTIVSDKSWKEHGSPLITSDIMRGENYDAQNELAGWDQPGLDVSQWTAAPELTVPSRALDAQIDEPVRQTGECHPKSLGQPKPGKWTYDLGQNMVGVVRLKVSAPAGTKLTLRHGESLNADGTIYTANLRGAPSVDTYVCKGDGVEIWQPHFTYHGFRYVELTGLDQPTTGTVTGVVIGSDFTHTGQFACSNPEVNQLESNILWGMRGNYFSVPTDCPQRDERFGWMGDAQDFVHTATYEGDVAGFFNKWLVDVDDSQGDDGNFSSISPFNGRGGGNPAWSDAGTVCPWVIYQMYGDKRLLEKDLPAMTRFVDFVHSKSPDLLGSHIQGWGDWLQPPTAGESTPGDLINTAFFAYSTSIVANSYRIVGNTAAADKYQQLFEQIKAAFNQKFVTPDGHLKDPSQCGYALALRFNLLPDDLRLKAGQYLADDVKAHQDHLTVGFVGVGHLLPALSSQNQSATAYRLLLQDTFPSWLYCIRHGATTMWEHWDSWTPQTGFQATPDMNSLNHYTFGACGEWLFDGVLGIGVDVAQPGFKHIILHPLPAQNLTHAEGSYDSIHGKISSKWEIQNGTFSLHVTIPINTTATLELPTTDPASVKEGGSALAAHSEIKNVSTGSGDVQLLIGSGDYNFTCPAPALGTDGGMVMNP